MHIPRKGYDSAHRRAINSQQVRKASECMLQGVVKEVSVCPLSVNELAASVEEVLVTSQEADGLYTHHMNINTISGNSCCLLCPPSV